MTTEHNTILLNLEYDEGDAREKIISLNKVLLDQKQELKALNDQYKKGGIGNEDFAKASQKLKDNIAATNKELKSSEKAYATQANITKVAAGSMTALRAQLSQMKQAYEDLSDVQRENAEIGGKQVQALAELNQKLKSIESSYGNQTEDVGRYRKAVEDLDNSFGVFGSGVQKVKGYLENAKAGLEATKLGLTGIKGAIASTGIGLLVLALGALVEWLSKTQKGMEFTAKATGAIGGVFNLLLNGVVKVGEAIFNAFDNPRRVITGFADLVQSQLVNRLEAFKTILDAIARVDLTAIAKGLFQLFTGVKPETIQGAADALANAAAAGAAIAKENIAIAEAERKVSRARAENTAEIEKQKKISEDVTKSTQVRLAAATEANRLEQENLKASIALQQRKIKNLEAEENQGQKTADSQQRINDEYIRLAELQADSLGRQTELQNNLNSIRIEGAEKAKEAEQKRINQSIRDLENQRAALEQIRKQKLPDVSNALTIEDGEAALRELEKIDNQILKINEDLIRRQGDLESVEFKQNSKERLAIQKETNAAIAKLNDEASDDRMEAEMRAQISLMEARLALVKKGGDEELELRQQILEAQAQLEIAQAGRSVANSREAASKKTEIEAKAQQALKDSNDDFNQRFIQETTQLATDLTSTVATIFQVQAEQTMRNFEKQREAQILTAGNNAELRAKAEEEFEKKREQLEKEAGEKKKKVARVEALINTAVGVTKALTEGAILGPILAAVIAAQGLAQQALISKQQFAVGGVYLSDGKGAYVRGPGTGTSDSINARLSNGEAVINAKSTRDNYELLSAINVKGGGKPFPGTEGILKGLRSISQTFAASTARYQPVEIPNTITGYASGGVHGAGAATAVDLSQLGAMMAQQAELAAERVVARTQFVVPVENVTSIQKSVTTRETRHDYSSSKS